tara:strand:+ start:2751 stop:3518 length:768 start_codon:yes stop_codon:yes gene_type:complete
MKKILISISVVAFMFGATTFKVSSITATDSGYDIQLDYMSDEPIGGYQFDFLSGGALTLTGSNDETSSFDGITTGNNVVLAFSFGGSTAPASAEYAPLVTLSATVNNDMVGEDVMIEAIEDLAMDTRLIVSDSSGEALSSDFHEALWTVGSDSFLLDNDVNSPISFSLSANYPNPFNPVTTIEFSIAEPGMVDLSIFDASGRLVKNLVSENRNVGSYSATWDGTTDSGVGASTGMYFYTIEAGSFVETKKMMLVK